MNTPNWKEAHAKEALAIGKLLLEAAQRLEQLELGLVIDEGGECWKDTQACLLNTKRALAWSIDLSEKLRK